MLRIELAENQLELARWAVAQVRANLHEQCEAGVSDLLDQLPVIQGRVLLVSDQKRGELSVADEFHHVLTWELERALDVADPDWLAVRSIGDSLDAALEVARSS